MKNRTTATILAILTASLFALGCDGIGAPVCVENDAGECIDPPPPDAPELIFAPAPEGLFDQPQVVYDDPTE